MAGISWLGIHAAVAAPILIKDGDFDTGWSVDYTGADGTFKKNPDYDKTKTGGAKANEGTLTLNLTYPKDVFSLDLKFSESAAEQALNPITDRRFGLRITLIENITNKSGKDWEAFTEVLDQGKVPELQSKDDKKPNFYDLVSDGHPGFAHFHNDAGQTFDPFKRKGDPDAEKTLMLGDGKFLDGAGPKEWKGIGIHQYELRGQDRSFLLRKTATPVPEPSTLLLLATGLVGLLGYGRRQRK